VARSAQELQYHFASRDRRLRVSPSANRRLFDRSPFSPPFPYFFFSPDVAFISRRSHTRDLPRTRVRVTGLLILQVPFPPASNRILVGVFLDEVRFRVRHAIRVFSRRHLAMPDVLLDCSPALLPLAFTIV